MAHVALAVGLPKVIAPPGAMFVAAQHDDPFARMLADAYTLLHSRGGDLSHTMDELEHLAQRMRCHEKSTRMRIWQICISSETLHAEPGRKMNMKPAREQPSDTTLRDGQHVLIRPIGKQDIELERRFIELLSPSSRRFRFLGTMNSPDNALLKQLVDIDPSRDVAFIALSGQGAEQREVGVARLSTGADERTCEFAVTVSDEWHHKGLGTMLMQRLVDSAMARGLESMYSIDAADNGLMREFAEHMGLRHEPDPNDATQVRYSLDLKKAAVVRV